MPKVFGEKLYSSRGGGGERKRQRLKRELMKCNLFLLKSGRAANVACIGAEAVPGVIVALQMSFVMRPNFLICTSDGWMDFCVVLCA
jgi:hypothetical protein